MVNDWQIIIRLLKVTELYLQTDTYIYKLYLQSEYIRRYQNVPQEHFDIFEYIQFVSSTTRSSFYSKLKCLLPQSTNNHFNFIYFNRVVKLWNALPEMDLELSILSWKKSPKKIFWCHFVSNFNPDSPCTWHYLCPCSTCFSLPSPINFCHL